MRNVLKKFEIFSQPAQPGRELDQSVHYVFFLRIVVRASWLVSVGFHSSELIIMRRLFC